MLFSDSDVLTELSQTITLEFVRDNPMFRQSIAVFEDSFTQLSQYCHLLSLSLQQVQQAMSHLESAQSSLMSLLISPSNQFSRCLFTNSLVMLPDINVSLQAIHSVLKQSNKSMASMRELMNEQVEPILECLSKEDLSKEKLMHKRMEHHYDVYEQWLGKSLQTRNGLQAASQEAIIKSRLDYELERYDLVERLNCLDCNKKILLHKAMHGLFKAYTLQCQQMKEIVTPNDSVSTAIASDAIAVDANSTPNNAVAIDASTIDTSSLTTSAAATTSTTAHSSPSAHLPPAQLFASMDSKITDAMNLMRTNSHLWTSMRRRLEGEIQGALPPPGSPPGAMSPVQPRPYRGMPLYSIMLTTELLSQRTRAARFDDVRHARDDGVFKQGFLFTKVGGVFGKRKRKWHRLFSTRLYLVDILPSTQTCTQQLICDMKSSEVIIEKSRKPFKFTIITGDKKHIVYQAENEDELVKWVQALRRCTHGVAMPGRPALMSSSSIAIAPPPAAPKATQQTTVEGDQSDDDCDRFDANREASILHAAAVRQSLAHQPHCASLADFILENNTCAECSAPHISWISTNIGVTLCEDCASAHRKLTWAVSKLKNVLLDNFAHWQIQLLLTDLGNEQANSIWEPCIPEGWEKPTPSSPVEDKTQWIMAKYRWYAFVEEFRVRSTDQSSEGIVTAAYNSDVHRVHWWLAHKADINAAYELPPALRQKEHDKEIIVRTNSRKLSTAGSSSASSSNLCPALMTPLHAALRNCHINMIWFLLQNGADIYAADSDDQAVIDIVTNDEEFGHPVIRDMMLRILDLDF